MEAGEGAIGRAQVYGGAINPLQYYIQQGAQNRAYQAQQQQQQLKQRDDLIKDLRAFNPDKVWEPFYDEVNRYVQGNIRDFATRSLSAGASPQALIPELERRKGDARTLSNKINWLKEQYNAIGKRIDDDDYLDPSYYHRKLNDKIFNGNIAKQSAEINLSDADEIFRDSRGYKVDKVLRDFMKDLPEMVNKHYTEVFGKYGQTYDIQETATKLGHEYKVGPDGKPQVVVDPRTGLPKINMTDDVFNQALGNEYLMNIVNDGLNEVGLKTDVKNQKQYLTKLLAGLDNNQIKQSLQLGFKYPEKDQRYYAFSGGYGYQVPVADLEARDKLLERITKKQGGDDLLTYFNQVGKDVKATYVPEGIKVTYPAYNNEYVPPTDVVWQQLRDQAAKGNILPLKNEMDRLSKSRVMKDMVLPLKNDNDRRAAKVFLSERMDEIDRKRSYGQDYMTYVNEKREQSSKKKGASGVAWK